MENKKKTKTWRRILSAVLAAVVLLTSSVFMDGFGSAQTNAASGAAEAFSDSPDGAPADGSSQEETGSVGILSDGTETAAPEAEPEETDTQEESGADPGTETGTDISAEAGAEVSAGEDIIIEETPEEENGSPDTPKEDGSGLTDGTSPSTESEEISSEELPAFEGTPEAVEDLTGLMTVEELKAIPMDQTDATIEHTPAQASGVFRSVSGPKNAWSFDAYYVGKDDKYHTNETDSFSLKYQMEFRTSQNLEPKKVVIRIPAALALKDGGNLVSIYREGDLHVPDEIAVPRVDDMDSEGIYSRTSPFNYYIDGDDLVFFNYRKITAGNTSAWQVLYKSLPMIELRDGAEWKLTPSIRVTPTDPATGQDLPVQEGTGDHPLTGTVDSGAQLDAAVKTPYSAGGNYTPGLYTEKQVRRYVSGLPEKYSGENFHKYKYMVWEVKLSGSNNQLFDLTVTDTPVIKGSGIQGEIVGYANTGRHDTKVDVKQEMETGVPTQLLSDSKGKGYSSRTPFSASYYVVTAFPADEVRAGTVLTNHVKATLHPSDGLDADTVKSADANWSYVDYRWKYQGNITRVDKKVGSKSFADREYTYDSLQGGRELYGQTAEEGADFSELSYDVRSVCRSYALTHYTDPDGAGNLGGRIPGASVRFTTVDDALYAFREGQQENEQIRLNGKDYYFHSVDIRQSDYGFDVFEDENADLNEGYDLKIYAMYADTNPETDTDDGWELAATVPWEQRETDGTQAVLHYQFTKDQIARKPWRVKAVYETAGYSTGCDISVGVSLRHDSARLNKLREGNNQTLSFLNVSGTYTQMLTKQADGTKKESKNLFPDANPDHYTQPGLAEFTDELYAPYLDETGRIMRANARIDLKPVEYQAGATKSARTVNDPVNGRVLVDYRLTAHDGYHLYSEQAMKKLQKSLLNPGRKQVAFYDLLPMGVKFDPSGEVTAGRVKKLGEDHPGSWDKSQVTVHIDPEKDVIEDYRGTGRTMLVFHVSYDGADSSSYIQKERLWAEGWGVSFRAYYEWGDVADVKRSINAAAFMPEDAPGDPLYGKPLFGSDTEVSKDDGVVVPSALAEECALFGSDINGDQVTDVRNVLYAETSSFSDVPIANTASIEKKVRADEDRFSAFSDSAVVSPEKGYTYRVTVRNTVHDLQNIVFYDRLENAAKDRGDGQDDHKNDPFYSEFKEGSWYGTFLGVDTKELENMGIAPVVYYSADRDAVVSGKETTAYAGLKNILTEANGWYTEEAFSREYGTDWKSRVSAVAVDAGKTESGTPFSLTMGKGISVQIRMKAPKDADKTYAFNNPSFYSEQTVSGKADPGKTQEGNSVKVRLGKTGALSVEKTLEGKIPEKAKEESFRFTLYEEISYGTETRRAAYANQTYRLMNKGGDGTWTEDASRIYATDNSGRLTLTAGQKAVFEELADASRIQVEEEESPFWKSDQQETEENGVRSLLIKNTFRPVVYIQKEVRGAPEGVDVSKAAFTFHAEADGKPVSEQNFWYVKAPRTDGGIPDKDTSLGKNGVGTTDKNGDFIIHPGEVIAFFPGVEGTSYTITETEGAGEGTDWICRKDSVSGTVSFTPRSEKITNDYRWKDLYLTKKLLHQEPEDCKQEFTFVIRETDPKNPEQEGVPAAGKSWALLDTDQKTETGINGVLDKNGSFSAACGGRTVRIRGLEAGKTYTITETESGKLYEPQNGGIAEVAMPLYAATGEAEITNEYQLRSLTVKKTVMTSDKDPDPDRAFEMRLEMGSGEKERKPVPDQPYTKVDRSGTKTEEKTDANGYFRLKRDESAVFKDLEIGTAYRVTETTDPDYPQISPAKDAPAEGTVLRDGENTVQFLNGNLENAAILSKKYETGIDNETSQDLLERIMSGKPEDEELRQQAGITGITILGIEADGTETPIFNRSDSVTYGYANVMMIDEITGETARLAWFGRDPLPRYYNTETGECGELCPLLPGQKILFPNFIDTLLLLGKNRLSKDFVKFRIVEEHVAQEQAFMLDDGTVVSLKKGRAEITISAEKRLDGILEIPFVNQISGMEIFGYAEKQMVPGSDPVPDGAELVWKLERFHKDSGAWLPAEGVPYVVYDYTTYPTIYVSADGIHTTGADGLIRLKKSPNYFPKVLFGEEVRLNVSSTDQDGLLRLTEVEELSDRSWGSLAGYGTMEGASWSMSLPSEEAYAFVNANRRVPIEIEKSMETSPDETFVMLLKHVVSASASPVTDREQIQKTEPGAGLEYTLHDRQTGAQEGTFVTGDNGEIRLRAGQYARLMIPEGTIWTVEEKLKPDYTLKNLAASPDTLVSKLDHNLAVFQPKLDEEEYLSVSADIQYAIAGSDISEYLTVKLVSADGMIIRELEPDEYTLSTNTAPSVSPDYSDPSWETTELFPEKTESFEVTVTAKDGKTAKVHIGLIGETDITREMVMSMKLENSEGEVLSFADGHVKIPEIIRYQGRVLKVVGIGPGAFKDIYVGARQWNLKSIEFPASLRWIKAEAFASTRSRGYYPENVPMSFNLPDTVEAIGSYAFSKHPRRITNVSMGNSLKYLGEGIFNGCYYEGDLYIPGSLGTLRMSSLGNGTSDAVVSSYYDIAYFTGEINIGEGMREITAGAPKATSFQNHIELKDGSGSISVPSTITKIALDAFSWVWVDDKLSEDVMIRVNQPKDALQGAPWGIHKMNDSASLDPDVVTWNP